MDCTVSPIYPLAAATRKVTIVATGFSPTNPDCSSILRLMKDEEIRKLYYIASPMQPHHLECIAVTFTLITLLRARLSLLDCIYTSEGDVVVEDGMKITVDSDLNGASPQFTLTCISTGGPATTVTWTRDSTTVTEGARTVLVNETTAEYVHSLTGKQAGNYACIIANNKPSTSSASLSVEVASAPSNLTAIQEGSNHCIRLSWTPSINLEYTRGYKISYTATDGSSSGSILVIGGSTSQYILSCLEWASEYRISILGVSRHFFSGSVTTTIPLENLIVSVTSTSATSISLSWSYPSGINSSNTVSQVDWWVAGWKAGRRVNLTSTSYTLERLQSITVYRVFVTETSTAGSFESQPLFISTNEDSGSCSLRETAVAGGVAVALVLIVSIATVAAITVCLRKDLCCTVRRGVNDNEGATILTNEALEMTDARNVHQEDIATTTNEAYHAVRHSAERRNDYENISMNYRPPQLASHSSTH